MLDTSLSNVLPGLVGYVHFDIQPHAQARLTALNGWRCNGRGEFADIKSMEELSRDHVWLSNLDYLSHKAVVPPHLLHIKSNQFLPISLEQMRQELGMAEGQIEDFAKLLCRFGDSLLRLCQWSYDGQFLPHLATQPTFAHAIAHVLGIGEVNSLHVGDELHSRIIWENLQEKTYLNDAKPDNDGRAMPVACLRAPMHRHAVAVMSCPVPSDAQCWQEINIPPDEIDAFFAREDIPAIVQVTQIKMPTLLEGIYPTSLDGRYNRREVWMPSTEAKYLRGIGHLEIGRVFIQPSGYKKTTPWQERMPSINGPLQLSYSAQMMCHAHYLSAAVPLSDRYWPMRAWWIRAMDRMLMAFSLMPLREIEGIRLLSFGEGCAYLQGPRTAISQVIQMAPLMGLAPTQSAWRASAKDLSKQILMNQDAWLPESLGLGLYERTAYQLSSRDITLTQRLDEGAMLAIADEDAAVMAIKQIMLGLKNA